MQHMYQYEMMYKQLYDGIPILLRTINTEGKIINCNELYASSLGYSKKELIGTSIFETLFDESKTEMRASFEEWKETGHVMNKEILLKRKNGTSFPASISANNLYDGEGNLIGSNTAITDLSEFYNRKKIEGQTQKELKENYEKLKKAKLEKDEFVNMITSEMRSAAICVNNSLQVLL